MRTLTCAIVEDSKVQRTILENSIKEHPRLSLVASFSTGVEALEKIKTEEINLLFLDIEMPILQGFDLLQKLTKAPHTIIISGNPKYALEAFEHGVTDYLLKPFTKIRFNAAVQKVIAKVNNEKKPLNNKKVLVKSNLKQVEINLREIKWIEALGDYVKIITIKKTHVVLTAMSKFYEKLPKGTFLRIHKSYIVNIKMIQRYNHQFVEMEGRKLPISRTMHQELETLLNVI